jgi:hypothetical protein
MKARTLGFSLWAVAISLVLCAHALAFVSRPEAQLYMYWIEATLIVPTFATLGALIDSRRPGNIIGWLFLVVAVAGGMQFISGQYAPVALSDSTRLPGGAYAAWLSTLMQFSAVSTILFLIMLFPTGRLLSPRWRVVAWTIGLVIAVSLISLALSPGPIQDFAPTTNPFGVRVVVPGFLRTLGGWLVLTCIVTVAVSLVLRFYRSRGEERLQLKWFVYADTLGILAISLADLVPAPLGAWVENLAWIVAPPSLAASAGIAILRYRLYDIDAIINRTLVYGALTAMLAVVYFGGVATTQATFRALTDQQQQQPQLAIVVSTLVIAALFNPLRRRIQGFIDRRFYRSKYDARKTLEAFSTKLKNETDLEALNNDLVGVVRETMQPAHVSVWLRPETAPKGEQAE